MLPDDVFRAKCDRTIAALQSWRRALADYMHCEEEATESYWRLAASPFAEGACAFEVILHRRQTCDLAIGPETYENRTGDDLDRLPGLAEAISTGRILTRRKRSATTGLLLAIESEARLPDGQVWKADRWLVEAIGPGAIVRTDHWYVPYRR